MRKTRERLTDYTLTVWQPRTSRQLSAEDAREIGENAVGFFRTLLDWDRSFRRESEGASNGAASDWKSQSSWRGADPDA